MVAVEQATPVAGHDQAKSPLPLTQRQVAQIVAVQPEQVESAEPRFASAEHKVFELWLSLLVKADDLAIEDR